MGDASKMTAMTNEEKARKELSDFLNKESSQPYDYSNWDIDQRRRLGPYEQRKSFSDRYRTMPSFEQTQVITEEDIPDGVDWTLSDGHRQRSYRWVAAFAFLAAFSISYCSNTQDVQKEIQEKYEAKSSASSPNYEPPAFRQGPKK
jgi:hypothetical protein